MSTQPTDDVEFNRFVKKWIADYHAVCLSLVKEHPLFFQQFNHASNNYSLLNLDDKDRDLLIAACNSVRASLMALGYSENSEKVETYQRLVELLETELGHEATVAYCELERARKIVSP